MHLSDSIEKTFRLAPPQKKALSVLGLKTLEDLLWHFPTRYGEVAEVKNISGLADGEVAQVYGKIEGLKTGKSWKSKMAMASARVKDESGSVKAVWFHQPYIAKMLQDGMLVRLEGKVTVRPSGVSFINPEIEKVDSIPIGVGSSLFTRTDAGEDFSFGFPVYPESRGITSRWFYHSIRKMISAGILEQVEEAIPLEILEKYHLPGLKTALVWIHCPKNDDDAKAARKRFAFEEVFFIQIEKQQERARHKEKGTFVIDKDAAHIAKFTSRFSFPMTGAQNRAIEGILADFAKGEPMSRLLEGDVGSGKTAVAATTAYAAITTRPKNQNYGTLQVAYMAPTEILATQHFESFISYFKHLPISIALITGSGCRKFPSKLNPEGWTDISRTQLLKWVANGEISVLIGTHALIQKTVQFKNLAYIIIDEQHRFGTAQRAKLRQKEDNLLPHLLSMTATPIPRTLALTVFGDLDLTLLDEMPAGRKPIKTEIVSSNRRAKIYEEIRTEMKAGRQLYVICPRIDEPDPTKEGALNAKSVKEEAVRLKKKVFPEYEIGILHSKMTPDEKDAVMKDFAAKKIDILVATSVVEVGVNVPNATMIIIEGGERFGLAQLHQLRGRVVRSTHQAYCYVFAEAKSEKTAERLKALTEAKNGFELAEYDLKFRGSGELYGRKQWGLSDLAMEAIKNIKMVEAARAEAKAIVEKDPELREFPRLKKKIENGEKIHFE